MAQPVIVRIVRDDGEEFLIDNEKWMIPNDGLENWANLPYSVSKQENASYDGGIITNQRVETVDRTVKAELFSPEGNPEARAEAIRFFSPRHTYDVHLTYQGRTRWCQGVQYAFKCETGNIYQPVTISWTVLCPMPFLLSESDFGQDVALVKPKFGFPYMSAVDRVGKESLLFHQKGFLSGAYNFERIVEIVNDGDVETYPTVRIKARGHVVNPQIEKDNVYVLVLVTMEAGDELVIDFASRPPRVTLNGKNVINKVDRTSTFTEMKFNVGVNSFSYNADTGENVMSVSLFYRTRFLGI